MTIQSFRPLAGIRVADFGLLTAGSNTSAMFADFGADVIKIESGAFMDPFRRWNPDGKGDWWNNSAQFHFTNRNKRGISVNLKSAEGRVVVLELLRHCDILVENFSRGVMERIGLSYAEVSAVNRALVYVSITSQGETGPYRQHRTYGSTLEAMGGLAAMTGYPDGEPLISGGDVNYPDQVVSLQAAGLVMAAVRAARRSGKGAHVDISQREVVSFLLGEEIVSASATRTSKAARKGNAEPGILLQQCFRASDDKWVAVTVSGPLDERHARTLVGQEGSLANALASWVSVRDATSASQLLCEVDVPAAPCNNGDDLLRAPEMLGESIVWSEGGVMLKGMPYSFDDAPFVMNRPAPSLGAHTREILRSILGFDEAKIDRLETEGILSDRPTVDAP
ncbi:CaiB/BaiF CoA transferase family protein [Tardiphaga sp. 215_C5_N2_1]|uniref:CaiB/BaiF CoA transferase family protein n=1 Tax=Tardiphaga sp. 215_C5_N2_1 TaxID=3240774 RepID=UPI003F8C53E4